MSRSRLPPTPSMSGEFIIKDQSSMEGPDTLSLPPAVLTVDNESRRPSKSDNFLNCPASPTSPDLMAVEHKQPPRRASAAPKRRLDDLDLPPPPTRTRKIIQMKPKPQDPKPAGGKQAKDNGKAPTNASQANSKKKQPSATSASGRKMARKTAHSLIERRRRSKMNEEFATLKDMIPACHGQEMHKLAILQASIDYVNYLEQCIERLKAPSPAKMSLPPGPPSPTSPETLIGISGPVDTSSASVSPQLLPEGAHSAGASTSASYSPRSQIPSGTFEFTSVLPSPVLGPQTDSRQLSPQQWPGSFAPATPGNSQPYRRDTRIDHEASAALLMLNQDRRGTADSINERFSSSSLGSRDEPHSSQETPRKTGMSVRDLLIS